MTILVGAECLHDLLDWAGENGNALFDDVIARKNDLDAYRVELIAANDTFAKSNPLDIVDDLDYNKRAALVFFSIAIEEAMRRGSVDFDTAVEELRDYFSTQEQAGKIQILGSNVQFFYPKMRSAIADIVVDPAEERSFGMP